MIRAEVNPGDFMWEVLQDNLNAANKYRRLMANTEELECMTWDIMKHFSTLILHTVKKDNLS